MSYAHVITIIIFTMTVIGHTAINITGTIGITPSRIVNLERWIRIDKNSGSILKFDRWTNSQYFSETYRLNGEHCSGGLPF
jgi:hypothetical protein